MVRSALAAVLLLATGAACSAAEPVRTTGQRPPSRAAAVSSAPATGSPSPGAAEEPAVTVAQAREALDAFLATDRVVRTARADRWTLALTRDGRRKIAVAQLHSQTGKPPRYTWGDPVVLVPRQSPGSSPQWFAATVERRGATGRPRTTMLTFIRAHRDARWQVSSQMLLDDGERAPEAALDAEGYATALDLRDQTVAISPNLMGPLHATVAEEGAQSFAANLIAPGPHTTGLAESIAETRRRAQDRDCMSYTSIFALGADFPVLALRTADGGALVFYTLVRTSTWSTDPGLKCGKGRPVAIPPGARWLLRSDNVQISQKRRIVETQQYVTAVPPKSSTAPARVIGYEGAVTEAMNT